MLMDRDTMSNLYKGPSIDASYQVSEEKIKMWKVNRRRMPSDGKSSHCLWQGELKMSYFYAHTFWNLEYLEGIYTIFISHLILMHFFLSLFDCNKDFQVAFLQIKNNNLWQFKNILNFWLWVCNELIFFISNRLTIISICYPWIILKLSPLSFRPI